MKTFEIIQFAASERTVELYHFTGSDLEALRQQASAEHKKLTDRGIPLLEALRVEREVLPRTLANLANLGHGAAARKAGLRSFRGKYTGQEKLSSPSRSVGDAVAKWLEQWNDKDTAKAKNIL